MMTPYRIDRALFAAFVGLILLSLPAAADFSKSVKQDDLAGAIDEPGYSPYGGRNFPTRVLWGDTHLHTANSLDARAGGVRLIPEDAFVKSSIHNFWLYLNHLASTGRPPRILSTAACPWRRGSRR